MWTLDRHCSMVASWVSRLFLEISDVELTVIGVLMIPHTERSNQPRKRCNVHRKQLRSECRSLWNPSVDSSAVGRVGSPWFDKWLMRAEVGLVGLHISNFQVCFIFRHYSVLLDVISALYSDTLQISCCICIAIILNYVHHSNTAIYTLTSLDIYNDYYTFIINSFHFHFMQSW